MQMLSLENELKRKFISGKRNRNWKTPNGKHAVTAYFIMGRSENSRNVFLLKKEKESAQKLLIHQIVDPSLIIYAPVRVLGNKTIVTNGDQTDTIYELMDKQSRLLNRHLEHVSLNLMLLITHLEFQELCILKMEITIMQCLS